MLLLRAFDELIGTGLERGTKFWRRTSGDNIGYTKVVYDEYLGSWHLLRLAFLRRKVYISPMK